MVTKSGSLKRVDHDTIVVRGAREHNLRNVDLVLPRDQLIVFTGLSGSGKSSLAFDTIYAEGQRRYVESLSAYARQFLGQMDKPDVDFIEGLSPAISIDQKSASRNPRSTVGTITEIYDYLRLLYARIGVPHCPNCGRLITRQTPQQIVDRVLQLARRHPLPGARAGRARPQGRVPRAARRARGAGLHAGPRRRRGRRPARPSSKLERYEQHTIEVVVDRLVRRAGHRAPAHRLARDRAAARRGRRRGRDRPQGRRGEEPETLTFSEHLACTHCGLSFEELAPRNFSFNSPYGACETCDGLGTRFQVDPELVDRRRRPLDRRRRDRAVVGLPRRVLQAGAAARSARSTASRSSTPWKKLKAAQKKIVLYGTGSKQVHGPLQEPLRAPAVSTRRSTKA